MILERFVWVEIPHRGLERQNKYNTVMSKHFYFWLRRVANTLHYPPCQASTAFNNKQFSSLRINPRLYDYITSPVGFTNRYSHSSLPLFVGGGVFRNRVRPIISIPRRLPPNGRTNTIYYPTDVLQRTCIKYHCIIRQHTLVQTV